MEDCDFRVQYNTVTRVMPVQRIYTFLESVFLVEDSE